MTAGDDIPRSGVTPAMREYLGAIDALGTGQSQVTTQRIAQQLGVSCPAVTNMLKRLHARGLVTHTPYRGVGLTDTGRGVAIAASRRRRLLERYLTERLGYLGDDARMEAARLEGAVTGALETHIAAALGALPAASPGPSYLPAVASPVDCSTIADDRS